MVTGMQWSIQEKSFELWGVCSYNAEQLRQAHDLLSKHNIPVNRVRCTAPQGHTVMFRRRV
jgi:diketogulonate reductase-like aldo/keto reductase